MILAYIISNSTDEAEKIAMNLMEKKLVYGVNVIPSIRSFQRDGDRIVKQERTIVLAKTKAILYQQIEDEVENLQQTGTAIVFSMPFAQMSKKLFENIQSNTLDI
jgi:uncharacterized protein involved in tolerance to divalent cations